METENKKMARQTVTQMIDKNLPGISGRWKLVYHPRGTRGAENFGGLTIHPYKNPVSHQTVVRTDATGRAHSNGMYILAPNQIQTIFNPDKKVQDKIDVAWLLHSPQVKVEGYSDLPHHWQEMKADDAQLTLTALDFQEMEEVEQADYIDQLVGRIASPGVKGISLQKMRYVLAGINLPYRDQRYINNTEIEKKMLGTKLKSFVRAHYDNAKKVNQILQQLDYYELEYQLKEMIRLRIVQSSSNGTFKYNNIPFGTHLSNILEFWNTAPEIKAEMLKALEGAQKAELTK